MVIYKANTNCGLALYQAYSLFTMAMFARVIMKSITASYCLVLRGISDHISHSYTITKISIMIINISSIQHVQCLKPGLAIVK